MSATALSYYSAESTTDFDGGACAVAAARRATPSSCFGGCCALAPLFILSFRGSYIQNDLKTSEKRIVFLVLLQITLKKW